MSFDESFLAPEASAYLERVHSLPFPVMSRLEEEVRKERQPAVGRGTGSILRTLVAGAGGGRVLEAGCNLGYSALWMAAGLREDGTLDTIEIDPKLAARAREHFRDAGLSQRVRVLEGAALAVMPKLDGPYDLVFLDAVKAEYPAYLDHAVRLTRPGGVIVADNMFWSGRAWQQGVEDADTRGVRAYTQRVLSDRRFATTIVPSEDGLAVSILLAKEPRA